MWDSRTGSLLHRCPDIHTADIRCMAYVSSARRLLTTAHDGIVSKWAIGAGGAILIEEFIGHTKTITMMETAAEGRILATCSLDGEPRAHARDMHACEIMHTRHETHTTACMRQYIHMAAADQRDCPCHMFRAPVHSSSVNMLVCVCVFVCVCVCVCVFRAYRLNPRVECRSGASAAFVRSVKGPLSIPGRCQLRRATAVDVAAIRAPGRP